MFLLFYIIIIQVMTQNFFFILFLFLAIEGVSQDVQIRVNLIGYEASQPKKAIILSKWN